MLEDISRRLCLVREKQPIVHHITNWVTINECANVVKAFGASPVMAHAKQEVEEMTGIASALALNIGTLTEELIEAMILAATVANKKGIPVILDVCGAGTTSMRDIKIWELLNSCIINVLKGNISEIARVCGENVKTKGVDASNITRDPREMAKWLALNKKCISVITGEKDILSDGKRVLEISNGHEIMSRVVGTGCMATSVIAAFCAIRETDYLSASAAALVCYEVAAEKAARKCAGPGTFMPELFDQISILKESDIKKMGKISEC
jgi:hydroxyethylthiazole kinase